MLARTMDILTAFPARGTKEQKRAFLAAVQSYLSQLGYETKIEQGIFAGQSLLAGSPESADCLLTAGNVTSAVAALLEIAGTLPENQRRRVCFVLLEKESAGVRSYSKTHKEASHQLVLQLGEIGAGDRIRMFPTKQLREDRRKLTSLYKACGYFGRKNVLVQETETLPVSHAFPYGVKLCSIQKGKKESYRNRIRTAQSALDETNVNILRAGLISFITCTK